MIPIISESFCRSEVEKIELFKRSDTASIHSVVSSIVENVVVSLLKRTLYQDYDVLSATSIWLRTSSNENMTRSSSASWGSKGCRSNRSVTNSCFRAIIVSQFRRPEYWSLDKNRKGGRGV